MPKITNEATMARPDTDTTPDDVTTPQARTAPAPDSLTAGPAEAAGLAAADASAPGPDTAADGRDGPDTATPADPPTMSAGTPPTVARTATRRRSTKPMVADATANGTTSRKKSRTATATTSAPAPDAETAPTLSPEPPMSGDAPEGSIATERPLRVNPAGTVRLKSGALQGLVEDFLTEHPSEHSPTAVGKAIARSSGAVANALERMVASGWAIRTCDKPKRYRIAEGSDSGPADVATDDGKASGGSAVDAAPIINPDGANPHAPTATTPSVDADNAPTAGRQTRRRTKTT